MTTPATRFEWVIFLALGFMWGSSYLFIKLAVDSFGTFTLVALRLLIGAAFLWSVMRVMRTPLPRDRRVYAHLIVMSIINITIPFALIGGVVGVLLTGGVLSLGSIVGFVTVLGIAARNGIMMVSHFRHLETDEGEAFGVGLVLRGAEERLAPILMTALATGLALLPLVLGGNRPGYEIEYPLAVVILGGLVSSTLLNLFLLPPLYLGLGRVGRPDEVVPPNNARLLGDLLYLTALDDFDRLAPGDAALGAALADLTGAARGAPDPFLALATLARGREGR